MGQTRKWIGFAAALIFAASCECMGQEQDDKVRSRLLEMKGDDDQAAMVAEMELAAMGEKALAPLKKIVDDEKDPNRAEAARVYPLALERAGRLTRVSLDFDDAQLPDVVEALNRQCKMHVMDVNNPGVNTKITLHREKVPYARALAEICQMVDGTLEYDYSTGKSRIWREVGTKNRPISEDWGNVVILDGVNWRNTLVYGEGKRNEPRLEINLKVILDPGMHTLEGGVFKDVQAIDEAGKPLKFSGSNNVSYDGNSMGILKNRTLTFSVQEGPKKIAILKGKMMEWVGYDKENWEIGDVKKAGGTSHDFGTMKLEIKSAELSGANLNIRVSFSGIPNPPAFASGGQVNHQMVFDMLNKGLKVSSDGADNIWHIASTRYNDIKPTQGGLFYQVDVTLTLTNPKGKADDQVKMNVTLPKKFDEAWIGFEFKDIDLF